MTTEALPPEEIPTYGNLHPLELLGEAIVDEERITYRIVKELGQGSFGLVYQAQREGEQEARFAIKVLHANLLRNEQIVQRFKREWILLSRFDHPNVIKCHSMVQQGKWLLGYVMDYIEGQDLKSLYIEPRLSMSIEEVETLFPPLLEGLQHVHDCGAIHRDIKPANIMSIQKKGQSILTLLDFGIARDEEASQALTQSHQYLGTVRYSSPEQLQPNTSQYGDVTKRSDIYAIGGTLFHLLTGEPLFSSVTGDALRLAHLDFDVPSLKSYRPEWFASVDAGPSFGERMDHVLQKALAKFQSERFRDCLELRDALLDALSFHRTFQQQDVLHGSSDLSTQDMVKDGKNTLDSASQVAAPVMILAGDPNPQGLSIQDLHQRQEYADLGEVSKEINLLSPRQIEVYQSYVAGRKLPLSDPEQQELKHLLQAVQQGNIPSHAPDSYTSIEVPHGQDSILKTEEMVMGPEQLEAIEQWKQFAQDDRASDLKNTVESSSFLSVEQASTYQQQGQPGQKKHTMDIPGHVSAEDIPTIPYSGGSPLLTGQEESEAAYIDVDKTTEDRKAPSMEEILRYTREQHFSEQPPRNTIQGTRDSEVPTKKEHSKTSSKTMILVGSVVGLACLITFVLLYLNLSR
ncbi:MAG: serine/threonine-protein kinase [Bacteroidota bacterium]